MISPVPESPIFSDPERAMIFHEIASGFDHTPSVRVRIREMLFELLGSRDESDPVIALHVPTQSGRMR